MQEAVQRDPDQKPEAPMSRFIAQQTAEYLTQSPLAIYAPSQTSIIFVPKDRIPHIFPDEVDSYGFHIRRGGYTVSVLPLERDGSGGWRMQPQVIGHEIGEVLISTMIRDATQGQGIYSWIDHPLKEGFCHVFGLDYYDHIAQTQGFGTTPSFDDVFHGEYTIRDMSRILGDTSRSELTHDERLFATYVLAGSVVSFVSQRYGLKRVASLFDRIIRAKAKQDLNLQQSLLEISAAHPFMSISVASEKSSEQVLDPRVVERIEQVGLQPDDFSSISVNSTPGTDIPLAAILSSMVDHVSTILKEHEEQQAMTLPSRATGMSTAREPSFVDSIIQSIDDDLATEVFGDVHFSAEEVVHTWRDTLLSRMNT